jgi:transcriptional regulator with PAS, ATPase and Fis domain
MFKKKSTPLATISKKEPVSKTADTTIDPLIFRCGIKGFECVPFESISIFEKMISTSPKMKILFEQIKRVARSDSSVLIRGETGTGKELVAKALHENSKRKTGPFRAINCATLTPELLTSELFGHVKGSFTGAIQDRQGLFSLADQGTLFLDEIAELPLDLQARLLRVLEEREFIPVGGTQPISVDVRIIAATHKSLRAEVEGKRFRADLMYRIRVIPLYLPPLRERDRDLLLLMHYFLMLYQNKSDRKVSSIAQDALIALLQHPWYGNIRELKNVVEYILTMGEGPEILLQDLPPEFREKSIEFPLAHDLLNGLDLNLIHSDLKATNSSSYPRSTEDQILTKSAIPQDQITQHLKNQEKTKILLFLEQENGRREKVAQRLGISRATLWRKMKDYGIT